MIPILHLRSSQGLYGADQALLALAQATPSPYSAIVGSLTRPNQPDLLTDEAEHRGLPAARFLSRQKVDFSSVWAVAKFCRNKQVKLVHAHDYKALAVALAAKVLSQIPVVSTYHGDTGATSALMAYERFARVCGNVSAGAAAVSRPLWQTLCRWIVTAPVTYIPNGLAPVRPFQPHERARARHELGLPADTFVIAVLGRLSVEKGHRVLIDALSAMPNPPLTLFAGEGPLRAELEVDSKELPRRFLGFLANTRPVYAACDLVVLPSLTEGLPMVALEAMAYERPLVATSVGELPALLSGGAGCLVPPNDSQRLAQALSEVVASPGLRKTFTTTALQRVQNRYSARAMAHAYVETLYAPALALTCDTGGPASQER